MDDNVSTKRSIATLRHQIAISEAFQALDNAIGMVRVGREMYASTGPAHDMALKAAEYLESKAMVKHHDHTSGYYPYPAHFLLHFAIAIRCMAKGPAEAEQYYRELGQGFLSEVLKN